MKNLNGTDCFRHIQEIKGLGKDERRLNKVLSAYFCVCLLLLNDITFGTTRFT
jgi:hypothetical protein